MNYEICIGEVLDGETLSKVPKRKIIINEAQRNIILLFANKTIDVDGYPTYSINGCSFGIWLNFEEGVKYYNQKKEEMDEELIQLLKSKEKTEADV